MRGQCYCRLHHGGGAEGAGMTLALRAWLHGLLVVAAAATDSRRKRCWRCLRCLRFGSPDGTQCESATLSNGWWA